MSIDFNLAIPGQARNDGLLFVTLNLFQGRRRFENQVSGRKIGIIYFNLAMLKPVQHDSLFCVTLNLIQGLTRKHKTAFQR